MSNGIKWKKLSARALPKNSAAGFFHAAARKKSHRFVARQIQIGPDILPDPGAPGPHPVLESTQIFISIQELTSCQVS